MISLFLDAWRATALKFRYQRMARERVLRMIEADGIGAESEGAWQPVGAGQQVPTRNSEWGSDSRSQARRLVAENPHARNVMRLLEAYVVGPECRVSTLASGPGVSRQVAQRADRLWRNFLSVNCGHFSYREFARRTWRDGECFVRIFPGEQWPPVVRFLDPETIGPTAEQPDSQGMVSRADDVESVTHYLQIDPTQGKLLARIPAQEVLHTKINADSNERRGTSLFAPLIGPLTQYERWLETEMVARKVQASVILWRKVSDGVLGGWGSDPNDDFDVEPISRERIGPGSIITTNQAVDLQFLQPPTHIRDAVPLGRMMLLSAAAGAGLPEYMLTGDASNANYASTMVAEGPAVKLFQSEQRFFAMELSRLWHRLMSLAVDAGMLPADFLEVAEPNWTFPTLVARDRPRERYADVRLVQAGILSRAEVARRENVDPTQMRAELAAERARESAGPRILTDEPRVPDPSPVRV